MAVREEPKTYLVECFWAGVDEKKLALAMGRVDEAASELRRAGRRIDLLGSILVYSDETAFLLFKGSEEDVRGASVRANVPFERVLESQINTVLGAAERRQK